MSDKHPPLGPSCPCGKEPGREFAQRVYGNASPGRWVKETVDGIETTNWTWVPAALPTVQELRDGHLWEEAERAEVCVKWENVPAGSAGRTFSSAMLNCDGSSGNASLEIAFAAQLQTLFELFKQRQRKYGCGNIARRGPAGILVRLEDKLARIEGPETPDESVDDSWSDVAVYAVIALLCRKGDWPGWSEKPKVAAQESHGRQTPKDAP